MNPHPLKPLRTEQHRSRPIGIDRCESSKWVPGLNPRFRFHVVLKMANRLDKLLGLIAIVPGPRHSVSGSGRELGELALQRAPVQAQFLGGLRDVPIEVRENTLDVFPFNTGQRGHGDIVFVC